MSTQSTENSANSTQNSQNNPSSPYYIHPSDNPGMKLISIQFNGSCYGDWKRSMLISLSAKNKIGFVNGTIPKPSSTDSLFNAWERCNNMLISWLLGALDQNIARSVLYFGTASEIWNNLEERYGQSSGTQLFSLKQSLNDLKQGQDSISAFYTKLKMLWDQLDSIDPIPICECTNCTCLITRKLLKSQQDRRLIEFMMSLMKDMKLSEEVS
ncbi:uncharacterized protein LOC125496070 [Beta vulgaris subsp. vulgaris]|uniref:uncharacterized protein LOC125496070 n=1 Tax=Beta vulgaris subsp. vulgaris TaxID=3555 RepID=UPI002549359F|nr:uncharacterized protein LOC125496070 [Beta vulgaris subsp. vulgaris]